MSNSCMILEIYSILFNSLKNYRPSNGVFPQGFLETKLSLDQ